MSGAKSGDDALKFLACLIAIPFVFAFMFSVFGGVAYILMHTWNWFAFTFHIPSITFWPSLGVVFLVSTVARWFRPRSK